LSKDKKKKKKKKKYEEAPENFDFGSYRRIWRTFGPHLLPYWRLLSVAVLGMILAVGTDLARPWPLKLIFDHVLLERPLPPRFAWLTGIAGGQPLQLLLPICLSIIAIAALNAFFSYMNKYLMSVVGESMVVDVRERIFVHLQSLSLNFHGESRSGDLVLRLTSDINKLKKLFIDTIQDLGTHLIRLTMIISVMVWMDWKLFLLAFAIVPILYLVTHYFSGNVKKQQQEKRSRESDVASIVQENMLSISLIQAYAAEAKEHERFQKQNKKSLDAEIRTAQLSKSFKRAVQITIAAGTAAVVYVGARRVLGGELSPGDLLVFTAYLKELYGPIDKFSEMLVDLAQATVSGGRLVELVEQPVVVKDRPDAVPAPALHGDVEFRDVSFHYKKGKTVLHDLTFRARAGQTVALVGSSGAGKSTIANLLLRFYDPSQGSVVIDGQDIRGYTLASLRNQITVVLQDCFLFRKTVRDNLAFGRPDATEEEIVAAARAAQAHDFIMALPQGYDTLIEERGVNFSGGQKQRLNIARAILRDSPILILDEPTTGLDALSEAQINQALGRLMQGRTTFVIAHRFSTIMSADHILVIEEGKLAEEGRHEDLLERSATYRQLFDLQYGGRRSNDQAG
jgi:ABC-type multidrug transport system fused ATPase/permease subunit